MQRLPLALISLAATAAAQDFVFPLGFGGASGPPTTSYPVARAKDQNGNGTIEADEIYAFATVLPTTAASGVNFMTDGRMVWEDGDPVWYFTDSEDGQVLRCKDVNNNGVIEPTEATVFFHFGLTSTGSGLFAPDTLGVYRDTVANQTRVYVALDNSTPSALGYTRGIHRLVDQNGDGDAMDAGEESMFVAGTMNLTVPGLSGPVAITRDFWRMVRVLPGGKVIAFAQGANVNGTLIPNTTPPQYTYTVQPEMNCWYGFTDNNGTAVPEVWFNASTLNDLPMNPAFDDPRTSTVSLFPNWDIQSASVAGRRNHYARFCDVVPHGGPNGEPVYYLASSYRTIAEGDVNLNGQNIAGLVYRVVDLNQNQVIDPGEISLWFNNSNQTYAGVAPVAFQNHTQTPVPLLASSTWGFSTADDDTVNVLYENGGTNDGVFTIKDLNHNGVIEAGEAYMPYATPQNASGYVPPFNATLGPYFGHFLAQAPLAVPGPFPTGVDTVGGGCPSSLGKKPVMEAWNGGPHIGTTVFEIGCIRGVPNMPSFLMGDLSLAPSPLNLGAFGLGATCNSYLHLPTPVAVGFGDVDGTNRIGLSLPNNPAYINVNLCFQMALLDPNASTILTYVVTNAMIVTIQP
ncbi:MAG: hypothetical protein U1E73_12280 [Planctomycetota bacterium]